MPTSMRVLPGAAVIGIAGGWRIPRGPGTTGRLTARTVAAGRLAATRGAPPDAPAKPQPGRGDYYYNDRRFPHVQYPSSRPAWQTAIVTTYASTVRPTSCKAAHLIEPLSFHVQTIVAAHGALTRQNSIRQNA